MNAHVESRSNEGAAFGGDYKCAHSALAIAELWPDHVRLSDLEPKFTCLVCGDRGTDIRPMWMLLYLGCRTPSARMAGPAYPVS